MIKHQKLQTTPQCSKRMANVKLKSGDTEIALAKELWKQGIRYRKNYKALPGSPDIAITKYKIAVFIDGEFWHGYDWINKREKIKSNREYWIEKIEENIQRDFRDVRRLQEMGWTVIRFWSKEIKKDVCGCVSKVIDRS
ncbi:MAG: very short patch repair endonuclease [Bacillota bacterium]